MKKCIKFLCKLCVIGVLLAVAGLAVLRLMYPPEKIKTMVLAYAQNTLHREIRFNDVSFNIIGFTLTDFALSEAQTFEQGTFIKADSLQAKVAFWPLLKKQIEISTIRIDGLDVNIIVQKDGSFNFDSLLSSTQDSSSQPTEAVSSADTPLPFVLTARQVAATGCNLHYQDLQTAMTAAVNNLAIEITDFSTAAPFTAHIAFTTNFQDASGLDVTAPIDILLDINLADFALDKAQAVIKHITASYKKIHFNLQGRLANFTAPQMDLTGSLKGVSNHALHDVLPDLPNFTLPTLDLALQATADLNTKTATISKARVGVQNSSLSAAGTVGWGAPEPTYTVSATLAADIGQLVQMTDTIDFSPAGSVAAQLKATDKKGGKDVSGTITLTNVSALYDPFTLSKLNGTIKLVSLDDISSPKLTGLLNNGKFTSSFFYKNIKEVVNLILALDVDSFTLTKFPRFDSTASATAESVVQSTTPKSETLMNITADVKVGKIQVPYFRSDGLSIHAALTGVSASMRQSNGTVSFALTPGAITDMDTFIKQSKIARVILLPLSILNAVGKKLNLNLFSASAGAKKGEIAYTKAEGIYTFTDGIMTLTKTVFESQLTNINASGTVDFTTNALDMKASATLLTKQTPVIIKIGGTLDNPSGKLDTLGTVSSVVGGILSLKTAKSAATGTATAAKQAASGAATTGTDAVKDTVKAIGSLFKKKQAPSQQ